MKARIFIPVAIAVAFYVLLAAALFGSTHRQRVIAADRIPPRLFQNGEVARLATGKKVIVLSAEWAGRDGWVYTVIPR